MTAPESSDGQPRPQGLTKRQAASSVLGCELDQLAFAALRHRGLGDEAQQPAQWPALGGAIHPPHGDLDALRLTCGLAHELVDAAQRQAPRRRQQLEAVTRRHARPLTLPGRDIQRALNPEQAQANLAQPRTLP